MTVSYCRRIDRGRQPTPKTTRANAPAETFNKQTNESSPYSSCQRKKLATGTSLIPSTVQSYTTPIYKILTISVDVRTRTPNDVTTAEGWSCEDTNGNESSRERCSRKVKDETLC